VTGGMFVCVLQQLGEEEKLRSWNSNYMKYFIFLLHWRYADRCTRNTWWYL